MNRKEIEELVAEVNREIQPEGNTKSETRTLPTRTVNRMCEAPTALLEEVEREKWVSVEERLPPDNTGVLLYNFDWFDPQYNPGGIREGFLSGDGETFISAKWFGHQDCYETSEDSPTHWKPITPPEEASHEE